MGKVNYTTTTLNTEGSLIVGNVTYNVNVTVVNNELTRLNCSIMKTEDAQPIHIGNINLEYGRQIIEIDQSEDLIPYLSTFKEIKDEILGKTVETSSKK